MTSLERVLAAMCGEQPDRVPVVEFLIDPKVARVAVPDATDVADAQDRLDMDVVGCGACFLRRQEYDDGRYVDEWGVTYMAGPEAVAHPIEGPIHTHDDAEAYRPPDPQAPHRLGILPDLVRRYKGRRAICFHHRAAFMWSAYLMGMENILPGFLAEPQTVEVIMDKVLQANMAVVRRAIHAGADVIVLGDDYASNIGPMFSPNVFRTFIKPRLKTMIDMIHQERALVIKHSDGNIYPILDDIMETGPDGLNPIEPVAGMSLAEVRRRVGPRACLIGNIDCGWLLSHGGVDDVRQAVRQAIIDAGTDGAYMCSSSNSIHSSCRAENVVAMIRAVHEFGQYPLQV